MSQNNLNLSGTNINKQYSFSSYHIVKELKLKELAKVFDDRPFLFTPLVIGYQLTTESFFFVYNFGSIVFFNLTAQRQTSIIHKIQTHLKKVVDLSVMDEYFLEVNPKEKPTVAFNRVIVNKIDRGQLELISLLLAQSAALEFFENKVDDVLDEIKKFTVLVGRKNKNISDKNILKMIKKIIVINQDIIVSLRLLEKPESAWEKKVLDRLYEEGVSMFELKERYTYLKEKLSTIQRNLEVLNSFSANHKMIILEVAIVGLFVIDVLLVLYEIFLK